MAREESELPPSSFPRPMPEGGWLVWSKGPELLLSLRKPTTSEIESVRRGPSRFALLVEPPVIWLLYRFQPDLPWAGAAYTVHLFPANEQPECVLFTSSTQRLTLTVTLLDADSAMVLGRRVVSLSPAFSRALVAAVQAQSMASWCGERTFRRKLALMRKQYPRIKDMLRAAVARTKGGE